MGDYEQVYRRETSHYLIVDYKKTEGDHLPDLPGVPDGYQAILRGHETWVDEFGVTHQGEDSDRTTYSNITLEGMEEEAEVLRRNYKGEWEQDVEIIRVFIPYEE